MKKLAFVFAAIAVAALTGANAEELGVRVGGDRDYQDRDFRASAVAPVGVMSLFDATATRRQDAVKHGPALDSEAGVKAGPCPRHGGFRLTWHS